MRRTSRLALLCVLSVSACGGDDAAGPDAGVDAYVAPTPSEDWTRDILHTALEVDIVTRESKAVITLAPSTTSTGASFEVGDLEVHSVYDDSGALSYQRDGAQLDVGVPTSESPIELTIEYAFAFHNSFDGADDDGYTLTWPTFCGNVFPCKSDPSDGLTFDLELTGVAGANSAVYPASIPFDAPSYMLAWTIGQYTRIELGSTTAGTKVALWHLPGHEESALAGTEHLVDIIDWYEQELGPYPFGDTTGPVEVYWGPFVLGGMEHHPYWHMSTIAMGREDIHAHEAEHAWFGNGIRIRCWEDLVLSEGNADYLAARALGAVVGADAETAYWDTIDERLAKLEASEMSKIAWPDGCGEIDFSTETLYDHSAYYVKGALFLRALERRVGVEELDAAYAAFAEEYLGKAASVQDFLDTIQAETGYDPTACANAWLRSEETPTDRTCPES